MNTSFQIHSLTMSAASSHPNPLVSVVMPVFNAESHLEAALESVSSQTYKNWELILIDDASTDQSADILGRWAQLDKRIRVLRNQRNLGLGGAIDVGMRAAQGRYVARMDADDRSLPGRIEAQVAFLEAHPDVVLVGCQVRLIDLGGRPIGDKTFPLDHETLYRMMFITVPMQHPTIMINRLLLPPEFTWYEGWPHAEDTLLFFKLAQFGRLANLPEVLFEYRYYAGSTSLRNAKKTFRYTYQARRRARMELGYQPILRHRLINRMQWLAVNCLPNSALPAVFVALRKLLLRSA